MSHSAVCWQCGASLAELGLSLPLSRFDHCRRCQAALHVCKQCLFHEPTVAKQCREPIAEEVRDKCSANFCDYFSPRSDAWQPAGRIAAQQARSQLDALFGAAAPPGSVADDGQGADAARAALNELFGKR